MIYFNRYDRGKSVIVLTLYYHKLKGKIEDQEGKKYLMIEELDKELDRIKKNNKH